MEISAKGGAALYAMQKVLQQPEQLLDVLQKAAGQGDTLDAPPALEQEDTDLAANTGKGQKLHIVV